MADAFMVSYYVKEILEYGKGRAFYLAEFTEHFMLGHPSLGSHGE